MIPPERLRQDAFNSIDTLAEISISRVYFGFLLFMKVRQLLLMSGDTCSLLLTSNSSASRIACICWRYFARASCADARCNARSLLTKSRRLLISVADYGQFFAARYPAFSDLAFHI